MTKMKLFFYKRSVTYQGFSVQKKLRECESGLINNGERIDVLSEQYSINYVNWVYN